MVMMVLGNHLPKKLRTSIYFWHTLVRWTPLSIANKNDLTPLNPARSSAHSKVIQIRQDSTKAWSQGKAWNTTPRWAANTVVADILEVTVASLTTSTTIRGSGRSKSLCLAHNNSTFQASEVENMPHSLHNRITFPAFKVGNLHLINHTTTLQASGAVSTLRFKVGNLMRTHLGSFLDKTEQISETMTNPTTTTTRANSSPVQGIWGLPATTEVDSWVDHLLHQAATDLPLLVESMYPSVKLSSFQQLWIQEIKPEPPIPSNSFRYDDSSWSHHHQHWFIYDFCRLQSPQYS